MLQHGRWWRSCSLVALVGAVLLGAPAAHGQGGETAGVITELKVGRGRVEVKPATGGDWRAATPLLALRAGDTVRATENASAVVLLTGGRGSVRVDQARASFVVPAPPAGASKLQKARAVLEDSLGFLTAGSKEPPQAVLVTRGAVKPPVILSPRNGPVLEEPLVFEWAGTSFQRATVRIAGPPGVILERRGVTGARFEYPADVPRLGRGVRYTFRLLVGNHPPQEVWFELLDPARAATVRTDLKTLEGEVGTLSPNSAAALRAGLLARAGLLHDARATLTRALVRDPDEATLHLLLGNVYTATGLSELAAQSYDEAHFLLKQGAGEPVPTR